MNHALMEGLAICAIFVLMSASMAAFPTNSASAITTVATPVPVIGFGVFSPSEILNVSPAMQKHVLKAPDYGDNFLPNALKEFTPPMGKTFLFYSVTTGLNSAIATAKANGYALGYDLEPLNGALSSPPIEYTGMINGISASAYYANKAAIAAHQAGLKFCIVPTKNIYEGTKTWPSILNGLNWNNIDCWYMQGYSYSGTASIVIARVLQYAAPIKAAHPNIRIIATINEGQKGANMTPSEVVQVWNGIKGHIDGIELHRYTTASQVNAILTALGR